MPTSEFQLIGWHSGPNGGGTFGLRFGKFSMLVVGRPKTITLHLAGSEPFTANVTGGFWKKCPEVRHPKIRQWIKKQGTGYPWPDGSPPRFETKMISANTFLVSRRTV